MDNLVKYFKGEGLDIFIVVTVILGFVSWGIPALEPIWWVMFVIMVVWMAGEQ